VVHLLLPRQGLLPAALLLVQALCRGSFDTAQCQRKYAGEVQCVSPVPGERQYARLVQAKCLHKVHAGTIAKGARPASEATVALVQISGT